MQNRLESRVIVGVLQWIRPVNEHETHGPLRFQACGGFGNDSSVRMTNKHDWATRSDLVIGDTEDPVDLGADVGGVPSGVWRSTHSRSIESDASEFG